MEVKVISANGVEIKEGQEVIFYRNRSNILLKGVVEHAHGKHHVHERDPRLNWPPYEYNTYHIVIRRENGTRCRLVIPERIWVLDTPAT